MIKRAKKANIYKNSNTGRRELERSVKKVVKMSKIKLNEDPASPDARARILAHYLVMGYTPYQICTKWSLEWDVSQKTVYGYIARARKLIAKEVTVDPDSVKLEVLAKYQMLFRRAMEGEDYREARAILDSIVKATQSVKHDITSTSKEIKTISLVEMIREVESAESDQAAKEKGYEDAEYEQE